MYAIGAGRQKMKRPAPYFEFDSNGVSRAYTNELTVRLKKSLFSSPFVFEDYAPENQYAATQDTRILLINKYDYQINY